MRFLSLFLAGLFLMGATPLLAAKKGPQNQNAQKVQPAPRVPRYTYTASKYGDPFVPSSAASGFHFNQTFDPIGAELGGIISAPSGRVAVLRTLDGTTFLVKKGRLINPLGKAVPGFSAQVQEQSVVVHKASKKAKSRYVYKLRKKEEGATR